MQYKYATIRDLIKVLEKLPEDTPIFSYNGEVLQDGLIDYCEYYTPTDEDYLHWVESIKSGDGRISPPYKTINKSHVSEYWYRYGLRPILYIKDCAE